MLTTVGPIRTNRMLNKLTLYIVASGAITRSVCEHKSQHTSTCLTFYFVCSSIIRVLDLILVSLHASRDPLC